MIFYPHIYLLPLSLEVLSGVTVYRSTRKLHPPSTNSDATFDNFNPPPFRVPSASEILGSKWLELFSHHPFLSRNM